MKFEVSAPSGSAAVVVPNVLNLSAGETHALQALHASGHAVTGLSWISSDASVATVADGVVTAVAAGHVTVTAGTASADVTVWAGALPEGTVIWSNPGGGSGVDDIVPAVPSASGVADVFAFEGWTVRAITSEGATAWTANVGAGSGTLADFQGGLVVAKSDGSILPASRRTP